MRKITHQRPGRVQFEGDVGDEMAVRIAEARANLDAMTPEAKNPIKESGPRARDVEQEFVLNLI